MKAYFLDTSAFIKRYLNEAGSETVDSIFDADGPKHISSLCLLETHSNIQRLHMVDGLLTSTQAEMLQAAVALDIDSGRVTVVNPTAVDIEEAVRLLARSYLTAVDALQVAIAIGLGPDTVFVSADAKLNRVAEQQGLTVLDPTQRLG